MSAPAPERRALFESHVNYVDKGTQEKLNTAPNAHKTGTQKLNSAGRWDFSLSTVPQALSSAAWSPGGEGATGGMGMAVVTAGPRGQAGKYGNTATKDGIFLLALRGW